MMRIGTLKGVLIIMAITNLLALLIAALFSSPLPLLDSYWEAFCFILLFLSVFLFAIAGMGGFRIPIYRLPGDKSPNHYDHDMWTGSSGINTEGPAFLISGVGVLIESIAIGLLLV